MLPAANSPVTPTATGLRPLAFAALVGTMAIMSFAAVIGPIVRQLGLTEWHAGLVVAIAGLLWMLMAQVWGRASDQRGRKPILMLGLAASGICYLLLALFIDTALREPPAVMLSLAVILVLRALIGLFYAAVPPTAAAMIADRWPPGERSGAMAKLGSANAIGLVVGPALAGWLSQFGLHWALYLSALLPLLAWLVVRATLGGEQVPSPASRKPPARTLIWDPRLRPLFVAAMTAMLAISASQVALGFYAIDRLGFTSNEAAQVAGNALTAVGVGLILAQALVIRLRQVPSRRWIVIGAALSAAGFAAVVPASSQIGLCIAYAVAAAGMGMILPSVQALTANTVEAHEQGAAAGGMASAQGLGTVIGPLLGTLMYRIAPEAPYVLVAVLLAVLAATLAVRWKSPQPRPTIS